MSTRTTLLLTSVLFVTLAAWACGNDAPEGNRLTGPGPGTGQMGAMGGGMGSPGASMAVASEFEYLAQMVPHHEEAIATAILLERGTRRPEMRTFAAAIVETQTAEVHQMKTWLAAWYPGRDTAVTYRPMMRDLRGLSGDTLDRMFLEDMIPHHMMAVMMSQQLVQQGLAVHGEVVPFAETIRDTQRAEIHVMRGWLFEWFGGR